MTKPTLAAGFEEFLETSSRRPVKLTQTPSTQQSEPMVSGIKRARMADALMIVLGDWNITRVSLCNQSNISESQVDKARNDKHNPYSKAKAISLASCLGLSLTQLTALGKEDLSKQHYQKLQRKVLKRVGPCGLNRRNQIRRYRDRMPEIAN